MLLLPTDVTSLMEKLGLTSLYIPNLISDHDYNLLNPTYVTEAVIAMLQVGGRDAEY